MTSREESSRWEQALTVSAIVDRGGQTPAYAEDIAVHC